MYILVVVLIALAGASFEYRKKIVGGENTTIEEYPYQLSLLKYGKHFCGALLIRSDVVLTTAHCVENAQSSDFSTRAGSTYRTKGGIVHRVKSLHPHPNYKTDSSDYDVAVLLLEKSYTLSASIQTIPIISKGVEVPTNAMGAATGWGQLYFEGPFPEVLQVVWVPKISQANCVKFYPEENVTQRMECYGYKEGNKDVCYGDSGGPIAVNGKISAISSWGYGCAFPERPNVYTKLSDADIHDFVSRFLK
ncbi:hypothetical protein FQA39_LY15841 [Lamprigera yunnana]|nr:hypothetical protein FQA39_LY15841 [Lamprigera yunnana]